MEPKVRFKGFEGEWEKVKLGNVCSVNRGTRITKKELNTNQSYPVYQNTNYPLGYYKNYNVEANNPYVIIGGSAGLIGFSNVPFWAADDCAYFGDNDSLDKTFLYSTLLFHIAEIKRNVRGSSVPRLDRSTLIDLETNLPSFSEQQSIATYFRTLDSKIQSTSKKLASLKKLKSASLVAMFPQNGESMPKVRFKGFEGEWKIKSFKELYKRSSIKNDLTYDSSKIISVANMYFKEDNMNTDETYLLTYNVMKLGDIAFEGNKSKSFAHGRFVENSIGNGIVSHVFVVFSPLNEDYDIDFWKYYINNEQVMGSKLVRCTKSSTMMTDLVVDDFLKETILVPSLEEQQELGRYFATLDLKIARETARLEKLKQIKLACLDKMFVSLQSQ